MYLFVKNNLHAGCVVTVHCTYVYRMHRIIVLHVGNDKHWQILNVNLYTCLFISLIQSIRFCAVHNLDESKYL